MIQSHKFPFIDFSDFLQNWRWQWFTTLTFDSPLNSNLINKLRLKWTRSLCTEENIQVAYFYVEAYKDGHPHLHLLMLGTNKDDKTLLDIDTKKWESEWPYLAKIEIPESNEAVSKYFAGNAARQNSEYDTYNQYLLLNKMLKQPL